MLIATSSFWTVPANVSRSAQASERHRDSPPSRPAGRCPDPAPPPCLGPRPLPGAAGRADRRPARSRRGAGGQPRAGGVLLLGEGPGHLPPLAAGVLAARPRLPGGGPVTPDQGRRRHQRVRHQGGHPVRDHLPGTRPGPGRHPAEARGRVPDQAGGLVPAPRGAGRGGLRRLRPGLRDDPGRLRRGVADPAGHPAPGQHGRVLPGQVHLPRAADARCAAGAAGAGPAPRRPVRAAAHRRAERRPAAVPDHGPARARGDRGAAHRRRAAGADPQVPAPGPTIPTSKGAAGRAVTWEPEQAVSFLAFTAEDRRVRCGGSCCPRAHDGARRWGCAGPTSTSTRAGGRSSARSPTWTRACRCTCCPRPATASGPSPSTRPP